MNKLQYIIFSFLFLGLTNDSFGMELEQPSLVAAMENATGNNTPKKKSRSAKRKYRRKGYKKTSTAPNSPKKMESQEGYNSEPNSPEIKKRGDGNDRALELNSGIIETITDDWIVTSAVTKCESPSHNFQELELKGNESQGELNEDDNTTQILLSVADQFLNQENEQVDNISNDNFQHQENAMASDDEDTQSVRVNGKPLYHNDSDDNSGTSTSSDNDEEEFEQDAIELEQSEAELILDEDADEDNISTAFEHNEQTDDKKNNVRDEEFGSEEKYTIEHIGNGHAWIDQKFDSLSSSSDEEDNDDPVINEKLESVVNAEAVRLSKYVVKKIIQPQNDETKELNVKKAREHKSENGGNANDDSDNEELDGKEKLSRANIDSDDQNSDEDEDQNSPAKKLAIKKTIVAAAGISIIGTLVYQWLKNSSVCKWIKNSSVFCPKKNIDDSEEK